MQTFGPNVNQGPQASKLHLGVAAVRQRGKRASTLIATPIKVLMYGQKAARFLLTHGVGEALARLKQAAQRKATITYQQWRDEHATLQKADKSAILRHIRSFEFKPGFSILMPVFNPQFEALQEAIDSVLAQVYPHWQLCIVNDASDAPHIKPMLDAYAAFDPRIEVHHRSENGHICRASNDALARAREPYSILFDHDDKLAPVALYALAEALQNQPQALVLYSDEDKFSQEDGHFEPYFKADFDEELLLGQNCISHLGCYQTQHLRSIGGFREGFEGSQDHDVALRATRGIDPKQVRHVPQVLYHWRAHALSTAMSAHVKPYAQQAGLRAVQDHLDSCNIHATVSATQDPGQYRVHYAPPRQWPHVTVLVAHNGDARALRRCLKSLIRCTDYPCFDIIVSSNDCRSATLAAWLRNQRYSPEVRWLESLGPSNVAAMHNEAAKRATGEMLCLLCSSTQAIEPQWMQHMVGHARRPGVGIVGAKLVGPDGRTLQHCGIVLGMGGVAGHAFRGQTPTSARYFALDRLVRQYSAVTGTCMMVRRDVFNEGGGLDVTLGAGIYDIDFCLKVKSLGHAILWTPFATLKFYGRAARRTCASLREAQWFDNKLKKLAHLDPFYNPNLSLESEDFSLSPSPRITPTWQNWL